MKRRFYVIVALLLAFGVTAGAQGRGPGRPGAEPPKDPKESTEKEKAPE